VSANLVGILVALAPSSPAAPAYTYDQRGNRTKVTPPIGASVTLTYDQANRLAAYGSGVTYTYNGDGLRMAKTVSATTTPETWDVAGSQPRMLVDGTTNYVYGPGGLPLEQVSPTSTQFYYQDQLGSTRVLANATGTVVAVYTYDPYGNLTGSQITGTLSNPFGYAGQYTDAESGLIYLRARYYDPVTGQFMSLDPLVAMTQSAYGYAGDNPLNGADPMGLCGILSCISSVAKDVGTFVYQNSGTLSTIASGLSTVAYATCAISAGIGCGLGLGLSAASTVLSGINTYRACYGGAGNCAAAAADFGISAVATVVGGAAQLYAANAISGMPNSYAQAIYLARQAGVIGGLASGISTRNCSGPGPPLLTGIRAERAQIHH
jgi:RHS repeat-associated protein